MNVDSTDDRIKDQATRKGDEATDRLIADLKNPKK